MKLISLNTWGGKLYQPLVDFIKDQAKDTDIFCFQEVFNTTSNIKIAKERRLNLYSEISKVLINHKGYFAPSLRNSLIFSRSEVLKTKFNLLFGLSIFIKRDLTVDSRGDFFVYGERYIFDPQNLNTLPRNVQFITFTKNGQKYIICNLHGIWLKEGKGDSTSRLDQSQKIKKFLDQKEEKKILCGDLNLDINTKSIKILEENMNNLVKNYKIKTTRNKLFPGNEKYADYIFVSNDVKFLDFQVPDVQISDHLPLILQFK